MNPSIPKSETSLSRFIDGSSRRTSNIILCPNTQLSRESMVQVNEICESPEDNNSPSSGDSLRSSNIPRNLSTGLLGVGCEKLVETSFEAVENVSQPRHTPCGKHLVPDNVPLIGRNDAPTDDAIQYFMATQNQHIKTEMEFMVEPESVRLRSNSRCDRTHWYRNVMLDWIIKAQGVLELNDYALYLAANILDRCFSKSLVTRGNLTLVGVTCLRLAHKHELRMPKAVIAKYEDVFEHAVSKTEIVEMETKILKAIDCKLAVPTSYTFLMRLLYIMKILNGEEKENLKETAQFLLALALMNPDMLKYRPSIAAAAVVQVSAEIHHIHLLWEDKMEFYTGWKYSEIEECANEMENMWIARNKPGSPFQQLIYIRDKFRRFVGSDSNEKESNVE